MMFASGLVAKIPNSAKSSETCIDSGKYSDRFANIRAAKEMSLLTISIPEDLVKASTIGRNE